MGNNSSAETQPFGNVDQKRTERGGSKEMNIHFAVSEMKGFRLNMEDKHIHVIGTIPVQDSAGVSTVLANHALLAVFDGHGGDFTSTFLAANFLAVLSRRDELQTYIQLPETGNKSQQDINAIVLLQKALTGSFIELDEQLRPLQQERTEQIIKQNQIQAATDTETNDSVQTTANNYKEEKSGSTAVIVLVTPSHILCANTGDSRALLRRGGQTLPLSFDHKPSELPERMRIDHCGGFVKSKRVNGDLAVSRAFGDFVYKDNHRNNNKNKNNSTTTALQQQVIVSPDFVIYPRNHAEDEFIILACDGIWDVASNQELSEFVHGMLSNGEVDLGNVCEECLDTCLDRQSRDNMTMMLVSLPGIKMNTSQTGALNNVLWGNRTARHAKNFADSTLSVAQSPCAVFSQSGTAHAQPVKV